MTGPLGLALDAADARAWFLDFDGTLVEFAERPEGVQVDGKLLTLVESLYVASGGALALISGRPIGDLDRLFTRLRLPMAGMHGLERRTAAGAVRRYATGAAPLEAVRDTLGEIVSRHPGVLLEDKGLALALHYRAAPQLAGYLHRVARDAITRLGGVYGLQSGKFVVEIRPVGRDKGMAIEEFMRESPFAGRTPIFIGDDATDEFGFLTVNRLGGYTVKVGPGPTAAGWRLRTVAEVHGWLERGHPLPRKIA